MNTANFNIKEKGQDSDNFMPVFIPLLSTGLHDVLCIKKIFAIISLFSNLVILVKKFLY